MAQRRFHYEQAFEHYLRANRVPYVAVDEAKKALLPAPPPAPGGRAAGRGPGAGDAAGPPEAGGSIKSFDFVVYGPSRNLLVDVKGRMYGPASGRSSLSRRRLESWVTLDDVEGMRRWAGLFGPGFEAVFVFAYCLRQQPPDALFEEVFMHGSVPRPAAGGGRAGGGPPGAGRWYTLREVSLEDYRAEMVTRSAKWRTVHIPAEVFPRISRPFSLRRPPASGPRRPDPGGRPRGRSRGPGAAGRGREMLAAT